MNDVSPPLVKRITVRAEGVHDRNRQFGHGVRVVGRHLVVSSDKDDLLAEPLEDAVDQPAVRPPPPSLRLDSCGRSASRPEFRRYSGSDVLIQNKQESHSRPILGGDRNP
jgi:hypothetical protein